MTDPVSYVLAPDTALPPFPLRRKHGPSEARAGRQTLPVHARLAGAADVEHTTKSA